MGDDGCHVRQQQVVRNEPADRHVRGRIDGAGRQGSSEGQQNPDRQRRHGVEYRWQCGGLPLQGRAEAEQHPRVTRPGQQAGVTRIERRPGAGVGDRADVGGVGRQRAGPIEARRHQRQHRTRLGQEAGLPRARRLIAPLIPERGVREVDQHGTRQSEHVGRLQSGVHHAIHHHVGREALRFGDDVVVRPWTGQCRHQPFRQGVLKSQPRWPGQH
jgi:hypothetical protein